MKMLFHILIKTDKNLIFFDMLFQKNRKMPMSKKRRIEEQ